MEDRFPFSAQLYQSLLRMQVLLQVICTLHIRQVEALIRLTRESAPLDQLQEQFLIAQRLLLETNAVFSTRVLVPTIGLLLLVTLTCFAGYLTTAAYTVLYLV